MNIMDFYDEYEEPIEETEEVEDGSEEIENTEEEETEEAQTEEVSAEGDEKPENSEPSEEETKETDGGEGVEVNLFEKPESFESPEQELEWHRNHFAKVSEEREGVFSQAREEALQSAEQRYSGAADALKAIEADPKLFVAQYLPEVLTELGISPVLSEAEIEQRIDAEMKQEFGENYKEAFNPADMLNPRSLSARMTSRLGGLNQMFDQMNQRNAENFRNWNNKVASGQVELPPDEQAKREQALIEENYKHFEKEMSREDYDKFVEQARQAPPLTMKDVYNVMNLDKLLEQAREEGRKEGRQDVFKEAPSKSTKAKQPQKRESDNAMKRALEGESFGVDADGLLGTM